MKRFQKNKIVEILKNKKGFTLLEMAVAAAVVTLFFTMVAALMPVWYQAYIKSINLNYCRQISGSVMGAVEQQLRFAGDIAIIEAGPSEPVQRITGKNGNIRFSIPMEGTTDKIDGLVYDSDFFMNNEMALSFELNAEGEYCTVTITISRDGKKVLGKTRAVLLAGNN